MSRRPASGRRFGPGASGRFLAVLTLVAAVAATPGGARAQTSAGIDVQAFRPHAHTLGGFTVDAARTMQHLRWTVGLMVNYADDPLRLVDEATGKTLRSYVTDQLTGDFLFAIGLFDILELDLGLPVTFWLDGEGLGPPSAGGLPSSGIGDLRLTPRVQILDGFFGLGAAAEVIFPTGNDEAFLSKGGFRGGARLNMHFDFDAVMVLLNLGMSFEDTKALVNLEVGHQLWYGIGVLVPFDFDSAWSKRTGRPHRLTLIGELTGYTELLEPFQAQNQDGLEVKAGLRYHMPNGLILSAGAGVGILPGYGTPDWRVFAGLHYLFSPAVAAPDRDPDPDCDRICDPWVTDEGHAKMATPRCAGRGTCKEILEGWEEANCPQECTRKDQCPLLPEDYDGYQDEDGCPDPDNDGDRVCDPWVRDSGMTFEECGGFDECPDAPEDYDGFEDDPDDPMNTDGCPEPDNDCDLVCDPWVAEIGLDALRRMKFRRCGDKPTDQIVCPEMAFDAGATCPPDLICRAVPDTGTLLQDVCPDAPERYNGTKDDDGCPDCAEIIPFRGEIHYERGSWRIREDSFEVLDQIARRLQEPGYQHLRVRIEGHTSDVWGGRSRGGAWSGWDGNRDLSRKRAQAVYEYLTDRPDLRRGATRTISAELRVDHERLEHDGFGWAQFVTPVPPGFESQRNKGEVIPEGAREDVDRWRASCRRTVFRVVGWQAEDGDCEHPCDRCRELNRGSEDFTEPGTP